MNWPYAVQFAPPLLRWVEATIVRLLGPDFQLWTVLRTARDQVIKVMLAIPPGLLFHASSQWRWARLCCWLRMPG